MKKITITCIHLLLLTLVVFLLNGNAVLAQSNSCTAVGAGQTLDINVWSDCKRVSYNGWGGATAVCAPSNTTAAEWQSFYNNPPPGVTISACPSACGGVSQGGYCYYHDTSGSYVSCDAVCAGHGGCNLDGTRRIGNNDPSGANCQAYTGPIFGTSTVTPYGDASEPYWRMGCFATTFKGGWIGYNFYGTWTDCSSQSPSGTYYVRVCACNN